MSEGEALGRRGRQSTGEGGWLGYRVERGRPGGERRAVDGRNGSSVLMPGRAECLI